MSLSGLWVRSRFHRSNHKAKGHASPPVKPVVVIIHSRGNSIISGTVLAPRPKATQSQSEFAMHGSRDEIYATGKALHEKCLRKGYADWKAAADRPDPGRSGLAGREGAVARTVTVAAWAHGALGIHLLPWGSIHNGLRFGIHSFQRNTRPVLPDAHLCNCGRSSGYAPKLKKRTALLAKLREIFRHSVSQPIGRVIEQVNPILRGWVNYFAIGDSSECFSFCQRLGRKEGAAASDACPGGFGFRPATVEYEVAVREAGSLSRPSASSPMVISESPVGGNGLITLDSKHVGKPIAGNRHDGFDEAGAGNQLTVWLVRHSQRKTGSNG